MNNHPQLNTLYQLFSNETQPFRKVHRMIDLFESIIKMHTVVILSEYVRHNKLSDAAKGLLSQGLRTPSLGTWQLFSRVLFDELRKEEFDWSLPEFSKEFTDLDKALNTDKTNVIAFRNGYAHGATPSDSSCEADIKKFEPFLQKLLQSHWLSASSLDVIEGKVFLRCGEVIRSLHPILLFRDEKNGASFAFFNDIKNDKIGLLNYPLAKHYREKDFFGEFHEYLPLHEWKKTGNNEFLQRIEELTETFKGRTLEREQLLRFVTEKNKGYFSIQGNPGIGKSALIAQFFKDLKAARELQHVIVVEYFIRRSTPQAQSDYLFNYLIKRTDEVFPKGREIRAEGKMIFELQNQLFLKWRLWNEHCNGKKLLFLIDGLDEGAENGIVTYLPRENFDNILFIFGSRPGGHKSIDGLWGTLPVEHHTRLELAGLGKEDIRALIYEVANKYEVPRESNWINAVQQRSQGNPLYLKLLCDALSNGSIQLNDIGALPKEIDEYYKAILLRYANDPDGDALIAGLYTFAAAKDYLTLAHLGLINELGRATLMRIGSTLKEVLYENPLTEEVLDYQLFHESFRAYLVKEHAREVKDAQQRIIEFCASWNELEGSWEQRYTLEHYAVHLYESGKEQHANGLLKLMSDVGYAGTQKKVLRGFDASNTVQRLALLKASALERYDEQLEAALCLVDLKYEEANDAPQVVAMVANGEIELALKRIESFGGTDEAGIKRKFILYMLCLIELTLLGSKEKPFRKIAIERLLHHLDEQLPKDHSVLDWNEFFPSNLMFQMAFEWAVLGLDYKVVYARTSHWDEEWIEEKGPYTDLQFNVMVECARGISYNSQKSSALKNIAMELYKQGKVQESSSVIHESLNIIRETSNGRQKSDALKDIAVELSNLGKVQESSSVIHESLDIIREISDDRQKSDALKDVAVELSKLGQMQESLTIAREISDNSQKSLALTAIAVEMSNQGQVQESSSIIKESLDIAQGIGDDLQKCDALKDIAMGLSKQGQIQESSLVLQKSLTIARGISDDWKKSSALTAIAVELSKQGQMQESSLVLQESLTIARGISDDWKKSSALTSITVELSKQGQMQESLTIARGISSVLQKSDALKNIAIELSKQGQMQESLTIARGINNVHNKRETLKNIAMELSKQEQMKKSSLVLEESLTIARGISDDWIKCNALKNIAIELSKQEQMQESIDIARGISDYWIKCNALKNIAIELSKQGQMQESLDIARGISDDWIKIFALKDIVIELSKQGQMQESLDIARDISDDWIKSIALKNITVELSKQGQMQESLDIARGISDDWERSQALKDIAVELSKQEQMQESTLVLQESLTIVHGISDDSEKSSALKNIAVELSKQGQVEESSSVMQESLAIARGISDDSEKSKALKDIAVELSKQGQSEESSSVIQESLAIAHSISDDLEKSTTLRKIAVELSKQGKWPLAESVGLEIIQIRDRQYGWKEMAEAKIGTDGWQKALAQVKELQTEEAKLFYLKGWAENVGVTDLNAVCIQEALPILSDDPASIEHLLQKHAIHQVCIDKASAGLTERLNHTLNIQWILDITAQFPKPKSSARLSTNLSDWLDEVTDEDDREQIELWAKQVAKGKMTENEFSLKVMNF